MMADAVFCSGTGKIGIADLAVARGDTLLLPITGPELDRLAALNINVDLESGGEDLFDRYARLAATIIDTSMAAIAFADTGRMGCKSLVGLRT
jgi:hypothetical protein